MNDFLHFVANNWELIAGLIGAVIGGHELGRQRARRAAKK